MRKLLVTLCVLGALLVGVDRVGLVLAERAVATQARTAGGLATAPDVVIAGFPFLTQVLRGSFDDVRVSAHDVQRGAVRLTSLVAELHDVALPLGDAVRGQVTAVPVSGITATALLSYADLAAAQGRGLVLTAAGAGLVRVTGQVTVLGRSVSGSAVSSVRLDGRSIVVTAQRIEVGGMSVGTAGFGGRLDLRVAIGSLPYGLVLTGLTADAAGVTLTARSGPTILR